MEQTWTPTTANSLCITVHWPRGAPMELKRMHDATRCKRKGEEEIKYWTKWMRKKWWKGGGDDGKNPGQRICRPITSFEDERYGSKKKMWDRHPFNLYSFDCKALHTVNGKRFDIDLADLLVPSEIALDPLFIWSVFFLLFFINFFSSFSLPGSHFVGRDKRYCLHAFVRTMLERMGSRPNWTTRKN